MRVESAQTGKRLDYTRPILALFTCSSDLMPTLWHLHISVSPCPLSPFFSAFLFQVQELNFLLPSIPSHTVSNMDSTRKSSVVEIQMIVDDILRVHDDEVRRMSAANPDIAAQNASAKQATQNEHEMSIRDALKLYPKAIMFSLILSMAVVMEGYDLSVMGGFLGFPQFKQRYGDQPDPEHPGDRVISAPWQSGLTNGVQVCAHCHHACPF